MSADDWKDVSLYKPHHSSEEESWLDNPRMKYACKVRGKGEGEGEGEGWGERSICVQNMQVVIFERADVLMHKYSRMRCAARRLKWKKTVMPMRGWEGDPRQSRFR